MPCSVIGQMNSNRTFCVTSMYNVGCTFLDWSLLYLSGQDQYYSVNQGQALELPRDPLQGPNAHGYRKNHPHNLGTVRRAIDILRSQTTCAVTSLYPGQPDLDLVQVSLGISDHAIRTDPNAMTQVLRAQHQGYLHTLDLFFQQDLPVVYVALDPSCAIFLTIPRGNERLAWQNRAPRDAQESQMEYHEHFFDPSLEAWGDVNQCPVWDLREKLALDMRPFDLAHKDNVRGFESPHVWLDARELWHHLPQRIAEIIQFLELELDQSRWEPWLLTYQRWQHVISPNVLFMLQLDHIVQSVVQGWHYALPRLSLYQEAIIQHCLIYQHNVNLRTWNLDRFPGNTCDLHELLEPNHHVI